MRRMRAWSESANAELLFETEHLEKNLKRKAVRGGSFTVVSQAIKIVLRLLSTAILARLLTPEDYGLIGMTLVVSGFVGIVRDGGLIYATVQRQKITHLEVSLHFWINVALGIGIGLFLVCLSPFVALAFDEARLQALLCALAIPFVFGGCTVQHKALLQRQMRFGNLAVIEIGSIALGIAVGIGFAMAGFSYWSLALMEIAIAVGSMLLSWFFLPWIPSRPKWTESSAETLQFGGNVVLFNVINYVTRNADKALIGWFWGAVSLGFYSKAYSLLMLPITSLNAPFSAVALPVLSRAANDAARLQKYFIEAASLVAAVIFPIVFCAAVFAEDLIRLWLGDQWIDAARIFQLLAIPALLFGASQPISWIFIVLDRTRLLRNVGLFMAPCNLAAFCIGLPFGPEGVALSYTISSIVLFFPVVYYALEGTVIGMLDLFKTWVSPFLASLAAAVIGVLINLQFANGADSLAFSLIPIGIFCLIYAVVMVFVFGWVGRLKSLYSLKQNKGVVTDSEQS